MKDTEEYLEIIYRQRVGYCPRVKGNCEITIRYTKKGTNETVGKLGFECRGKEDCPYYKYENGYEYCPVYQNAPFTL